MANALEIKPTLGSAIRAISGKWGWFVALGIVDLALGGIASTNLILASLASALFIGGAVLASGLLHIVHALSVRNLRGFLLWFLAGAVYAAAGAIIIYDPVLASVELSLLVGVFMVVAGGMRAWAGFHSRPAAGWRWVTAAGALTACFGIVLIAAWPGIGLWFLGAMLVVDLIFQGWGFAAFGIAMKVRASRHRSEYVHG